jgi:hypothetical protein
MLYRMLLRQISRCRIGWKYAIGGYVSALSHATYPASIVSGGHLEFASIRALAQLNAPTGDNGNCDVRQGMRVPFRYG